MGALWSPNSTQKAPNTLKDPRILNKDYILKKPKHARVHKSIVKAPKTILTLPYTIKKPTEYQFNLG